MSLLKPFNLLLPQSLEEASQLLKENPNSMILGGGTDLIPKLNRGQFSPSTLISLAKIPHLDKIEEKDSWLIIGAMAPLWRLESHPKVQKIWGFWTAIQNTASHGIRGTATLGGNLLQDSRCKYVDKSPLWRQGVGYCMKVQGDICRVAPKSSFCSATFCSDLAPILIALGSKVVFQNLDQKRTLELRDLYGKDGREHILKKPWEVLAEIHIPLKKGFTWSKKITSREGIDFPEVNLALYGEKQETKILLHLVLGALDTKPLSFERTFETAQMEKSLLSWMEEIYSQLKPKDTLYYPPLYRKKMAKVLFQQGLKAIQKAFSTP